MYLHVGCLLSMRRLLAHSPRYQGQVTGSMHLSWCSRTSSWIRSWLAFTGMLDCVVDRDTVAWITVQWDHVHRSFVPFKILIKKADDIAWLNWHNRDSRSGKKDLNWNKGNINLSSSSWLAKANLCVWFLSLYNLFEQKTKVLKLHFCYLNPSVLWNTNFIKFLHYNNILVIFRHWI